GGVLRGARLLFGPELRVEVRRLLRDLGAPALGGLRGLAKLQELELEVVAAALLRRERQAFVVIFLLPRLQRELDGVERRARLVGRGARRRETAGQLVELPLPGDDAMQFAVGGEQRHALLRDEVAFGRDERLAHAKVAAVRERAGEARAAAHAIEA